MEYNKPGLLYSMHNLTLLPHQKISTIYTLILINCRTAFLINFMLGGLIDKETVILPLTLSVLYPMALHLGT